MSVRGIGCLVAQGGQQPVEIFTARAASAQVRGDAWVPLLDQAMAQLFAADGPAMLHVSQDPELL